MGRLGLDPVHYEALDCLQLPTSGNRRGEYVAPASTDFFRPILAEGGCSFRPYYTFSIGSTMGLTPILLHLLLVPPGLTTRWEESCGWGHNYITSPLVRSLITSRSMITPLDGSTSTGGVIIPNLDLTPTLAPHMVWNLGGRSWKEWTF